MDSNLSHGACADDVNLKTKEMRLRAQTMRAQALWISGGDRWCSCVRGEGVQGVFTLFYSGAAQVCNDDRVVELKEQLEVEEEDGDRQEGKVEVERERRIKEVRP